MLYGGGESDSHVGVSGVKVICVAGVVGRRMAERTSLSNWKGGDIEEGVWGVWFSKNNMVDVLNKSGELPCSIFF